MKPLMGDTSETPHKIGLKSNDLIGCEHRRVHEKNNIARKKIPATTPQTNSTFAFGDGIPIVKNSTARRPGGTSVPVLSWTPHSQTAIALHAPRLRTGRQRSECQSSSRS